MSTVSFRQLTQSKGLKVGFYIGELMSPGMGQIIRGTGCEFAMLDMEHSGFGYETVKSTLRSLHDAGIASILRPPSQAYHHVARACDVGAQGVMPPMLSTADEARSILDAMKYVPQGMRGVALGIAHDDYQSGTVDQKLRGANEKTSLVALIETAQGVAEAEAIAAINGVDCLWIGHFDLTCSLGIPGQFDHPDFLGAVDRIAAAAKGQGKSLGRLVTSVEEGAALYAQGFDMIIYGSDIHVLRTGLTAGVEGLRRECGG